MKQKIIYIFALILVSLSNASAQLTEDFYDEYIENICRKLLFPQTASLEAATSTWATP